jgi:phospholipase C
MNRLRALFFSAAALAGVGCSSSVGSTPAPGPSAPPPPAVSPIAHIVIMVEENRSFNVLFAGFPGANTALVGPCKPAPWCKGSHMVALHQIKLATGGGPLFGRDIDHTNHAFKVECDINSEHVCLNDGFDLIRFGQSGQLLPAKLYPYAYIDRAETKPYWDLAHQYTLSDSTFFDDTASSFIAHQIIISGTVRINDRESLTNQPPTQPWGCDAPPKTQTPVILRNGFVNPDGPFPCFTQYGTMADLLDAKGVSWLFYADKAFGKNSDFSGSVWNGYRAIHKIFYGPDWKTNISSPNLNIFSDLKAGTLPSVSWVIPSLFDSDHPASGCDGGPYWITKVVNAIGTSAYWKDTAIVLLWDDWGGWYDNAPPPQVNYTSQGFRVPMIVISPYAKPGFISHTPYDFGSILKLVEQTFDLGSLGTDDAKANSMENVFDFTQTPNVFHPAPIPAHMPCATQVTNPSDAAKIIEHDRGVPE